MDASRVLVVDDEPDILEAIRAFLQGSLGVDVVTADSGAAALEALRKTPVDLVLSDYRMPGMDGLAFLRQAEELLPDVPRVLMTAFPDMQLAISAVNEASVSRFLTKPVDPSDLGDLVSGLLSVARRRRLGEQAMLRSASVRPDDAPKPPKPPAKPKP